MASFEGSFNFHSASSAHSGGVSESMDFDQLSQVISRNVQTMTHNGYLQIYLRNTPIYGAQMETMLSQYGTRSDSLQLRDRLHEIQHRTNQIAKDTGTYVKDLNRLSASQHSVEPRYQKIQRERLVAEFMKVLNTFQNVQRMEKEMEKSTSLPTTQPQSSTFNPFTDDEPQSVGSSSRSHTRMEEIDGGHQKMSLTIDSNDVDYEMMREREDALQRLETDIMDVNQIFRDLGMLVHEQGDVIDSIEANIETASVSVEQGVDQLRQARRSQSKARKKKFICLFLLLVILAIIITVIILIIKYR